LVTVSLQVRLAGGTIEDSCEQRVDAGQQYHIRLGWIEKTLAKEKENG